MVRNDRSTGLGRGRIFTAVVLGLGAVVLLIASLLPTRAGLPGDAVSLPDFFLAVGASAAVASVFFFLSAQIKRAEARTDEAIDELRQEVTSLSEELQYRAARRDAAAQAAARELAVADAPTVQSLIDVSSAAANRGLGEALFVALRGLRQLGLASMWTERQGGSVQQVYWLGIEEVPEHVSDPSEPSSNPLEWHRRQKAVVEVLPDATLADALDRLQAHLEKQQASWPEFSHDCEQALSNLSLAMASLFEAGDFKVGTIDVVLDEHYVLTRHEGSRRLLVDVREPDKPRPVTLPLAKAAEKVGTSSVLNHALVARHLAYERRVAEEARKLLDRKRATRAMNRGFRSGS